MPASAEANAAAVVDAAHLAAGEERQVQRQRRQRRRRRNDVVGVNVDKLDDAADARQARPRRLVRSP